MILHLVRVCQSSMEYLLIVDLNAQVTANVQIIWLAKTTNVATHVSELVVLQLYAG